MKASTAFHVQPSTIQFSLIWSTPMGLKSQYKAAISLSKTNRTRLCARPTITRGLHYSRRSEASSTKLSSCTWCTSPKDTKEIPRMPTSLQSNKGPAIKTSVSRRHWWKKSWQNWRRTRMSLHRSRKSTDCVTQTVQSFFQLGHKQLQREWPKIAFFL